MLKIMLCSQSTDLDLRQSYAIDKKAGHILVACFQQWRSPKLVRLAHDSKALRFELFYAVTEHKLQTDKHVSIF